MYTVSHYQGHNEPLDVELFEGHEGEAREIILQSYIDEGMISETVPTIDESNEYDIELEVTDWLTPFEIEQLKTFELYCPEDVWDTLTVESLSDILKSHRDEREVA